MNSTIKGILLGIGGVMTLSAMDSIAKSLGASLNIFLVVFVRYLGAAIWLAFYLVLTKRAWPQRKNYSRHMLRGALMAMTACFFFYGVTHLPLAIAAALAMSAPLYISLFGIVLLKEKFSPVLAIAIVLGVVGSLVVVLGGTAVTVTGSADILAWGAAILAPISYASAIVLLKHHSGDEGAASMTLAQSLVAAIIVMPLAVVNFSLPAGIAWVQVCFIGLLGAIGFLLLIAGLRRIPASVFSIVDYTGLLWAGIFGYLFFAEIPPPQLWFGGALIILACAISTHSHRAPRVKPAKA
ncbi:DMT family transporter [Devosia rhodophyticola]|uniref:DMT family transporter n=1 Tax=Devosia rhodophyticola TaxID=3026423 RepID=A0ABY7YZQ8_9HYPH|nr:DMT family transporter [Devosia rhodophyticola]WDR06255.1 DMT family transporter [Devosia rhodophyticola]